MSYTQVLILSVESTGAPANSEAWQELKRLMSSYEAELRQLTDRVEALQRSDSEKAERILSMQLRGDA